MAVEVGMILEGRITGVKKFGAFVALPEGKVGMVHISEVSNQFVEDITAVLHEGDTVKVKVMSIGEDGKIALSIKRTLPPPTPKAAGERKDGPRPARRKPAPDAPRVWQPKPVQSQENMSFEDMMSQFKSRSEEKIADSKRWTENRRGGGYSRRR